MKIIVVGMGVIGTAVANLLARTHEVRSASRSRGDLQVDARSIDSIEAFYKSAGDFDAVIMALGTGKVYTPFWELTPQDYDFAYYDRAVTQINMVRIGVRYINDKGSFTLSSGFMNKTPMPGFTAITTSNGAIDGFVAGAAKDMPRGIRINGVSATFVQETMELRGMTEFGGLEVVSAGTTALAYKAAVEGSQTGQDIDSKAFL
jgi:enoyl-[acyl-carrier-protein] reductase (NADH)